MRNKIWVLGFKLFAIAAVAGLALGTTNALTEAPIEQQEIIAADAARRSVLPDAETFEQLDAPEGLSETYAGYDANGKLAGKTGKIVTKGYGGEIEVTVGVDNDGTITGVYVGGSNFSETAGLGARTKETWFGVQFIGKDSSVSLKKDGGDIDAVTSATISSRAVTKAVGKAAGLLAKLNAPAEG
ncbi:MAG TPA: FMN-binding protein [Eubacteriales bacterium]|nr:FMN-binding protein [Eubacteriales bacterium]